jgi:hypothetical protein
VQPFNLSFEPDDLHVMAYFCDHPEYEAVEAMIRFRAKQLPLVRAILTRHDQSQIDHSNDFQSPAALGEHRQRCTREIACVFENTGTSRRVSIRFESFQQEVVELDVISVGLPDAKRAGLSDPGSHSVKSSLPIMYRGKSALVAPQSHVRIDGRPLQIPARLEVGGRVIALNGFLTEMHHMAAFRSGIRDLELLEMPAALEEGGRWIYRSANELMTYRILRLSDAGDIEVTREDTRTEWIDAKVVGDKIALTRVRVRHRAVAQHFVSLTFSDSAFAVDIDSAGSLVTGMVEESKIGAEQSSISLSPTAPAWSANRPVTVNMLRPAHGRISIDTAIG